MSIAVSWADLVQLKKSAKAAKETLHLLSHMQRLDAVAREKFGVRHFHELQKLYEASVAQYVTQQGGIHLCGYCGVSFAGDVASDVQEHLEHHRRYEEVERALGFVPLTLAAREKLKKLGYAQVHAADEAQQRAGALMVMLAYFERSLDAAIGARYWPRHPCFKRYISYALPTARYMPEQVRQRLMLEFGSMPGVIEAGTDWPCRVQPNCPDDAAMVKDSMELRTKVLKAAESARESE